MPKLPKPIKVVWSWAAEIVSDFFNDGALALSAAISFYTMFSLAPLLIVVIAISGAVFGAEAARGEIVGQFSGLIGQKGAEGIETVIQNASQQQAGVLATIIGIVTVVLGATGVFGQLKTALNTVWEVQTKPGGGIVGLIRNRILSFAMVLCIAFLLLTSLAISAGLAAAGKWLGGYLPVPESVLHTINFAISLGALTVLFAAMFKFLPDAIIPWRNVWMGAAATAGLFTLGKFLIGLYLGKASIVSVYGAAGSLVLVLLWVYYSALIFLFGAEFTQVYASRHGSRIRPNKYAVSTQNRQ